MWSRKSAAVLPLALAACATSGVQTDLTAPQIDLSRMAGAPEHLAGPTALSIEDTAQPGVFHAYLRNDGDLFSEALNAKFAALIRAYCDGREPMMLRDVLIITSGQREPDDFIDNEFRCEGAPS